MKYRSLPSSSSSPASDLQRKQRRRWLQQRRGMPSPLSSSWHLLLLVLPRVLGFLSLSVRAFRPAVLNSYYLTGQQFRDRNKLGLLHPRSNKLGLSDAANRRPTPTPPTTTSRGGRIRNRPTAPPLRMIQESNDNSIDQTKDQPMMLYNSLTRTKHLLQPLNPPRFTMYTCGPTVYDSAHIGNFRAFLTYDVLKRVLLYLGYDVEHVCNLTDIDDKIITRANHLKASSIRDITDKYADLFLHDLQALNVVPATHYPRATNHVQDMADMIRGLESKGLAYETSDGSWYFDTQKQPSYGTHLVQLNFDEMMKAGSADDDGDAGVEKRHFADFCLWKAFKEGIDRDDAAWTFPPHLQKGRPGWHLECSAMVHHYFGSQTIDLHGGGVDLKFPHHENEIAQSQGFTDNTYCNCWFHNGFVNIDNEKMSKSLGNFRTLKEACPTPLSIRAYRYLVISSQYRNPLSFTQQAIQASQKAVTRIDKVRTHIQQALHSSKTNGASSSSQSSSSSSSTSTVDATTVARAIEQFEAAIRDDLAMPRASAALFALVKEAERIFKNAGTNAAEPSLTDADLTTLHDIDDAMNRMDKVFGIFYSPPSQEDDGSDASDDDTESGIVPEHVRVLVSERVQAKADKDWARADSLRSRISELGYHVKDVKDGDPIISRSHI